MGLFGPKKSKEEKNYEAVYKKFPSKKAGTEDLEAAIAAWEAADGPKKEVWKAYFMLAIAYDCGRKVEMDELKAKNYHDKARRLIEESGDMRWKTWADSFYYWYGQSAINFEKKLDAQTLNVRRLGNAAMNAIGLTGLGFMINEIDDTIGDVWIENRGVLQDTAKAFHDYLMKCRYCLNKEEELKNHNADSSWLEYDKSEIDEFLGRALKEFKEESGETDFHQYIVGLAMVQKSPCCFAYRSNDPLNFFVVRMFNTAIEGNAMALHQLVMLAFRSPDDHKYVAKCLQDMAENAMDHMLKNYLEKAENAGDYTATELLNRYFAG